jgi:NADH-quinone oxidoreductase subunit C
VEKFLKELQSKFPEVVEKIEEKDVPTIICKREGFLDFIKYLKEEKKFDYLIDLCGVDYLNYKPGGVPERFEVVYHLYSISTRILLRLKVRVPENDCWHYSVTPLWKTANWFERECYDMFGIKFKGHPDLRRVLMPYDWKGHPLRKDYPLFLDEEHEWKVYKELKERYKGKR